MASKQRETAIAFLDTFESLDLEGNLALRAVDCRHDMAPESMGYGPSKNNKEFADHFQHVKEVIVAFPVTAKEIFEHEGSNQVTVWATSSAEFRDEVKDDDPSVDWSYRGEYMFVFFFDSTDTKINRIIEFIDSHRVVGVQALIKRARANLESKAKTKTS